jgi:hypothetical protein
MNQHGRDGHATTDDKDRPVGLTCPQLEIQPYRLLECDRAGRGDPA